MIRNLKTLGLALAAVFAFGAMSAAGASAQGVLTSDGPVTLHGTENAAGVNALTAFGGETRCPETTYTGKKTLSLQDTSDGVEHGPITSGDTSATIIPHYKGCFTVSGGSTFSTTVDMNGCDYDFELGGTVNNEANTYDVKAFVTCPEGAHIQVTQFSGSSHGFRVCSVTIEHNETGYDGLHATDTTNGKIDVEGSVEGIKASRGGLCGSATDENAVLHQDITIEGRNEGGATTTIGLSH